jgi:hypothetical protein
VARPTTQITDLTHLGKTMRFNTNLFRDRAIVNVDDESFGITFTHWTRKRQSWSLRWLDVVVIEVTMVEVPFNGDQLRLLFQGANGHWYFISDDMENWGALAEVVRKRFLDFNWSNVDVACHLKNRNKRFPCWKQPTV